MKRLLLTLALAACEAKIDAPAPPMPVDDMKPVDCAVAPLPGRRLRRLSRPELVRSTNELAAASVVSVQALASDLVVDGFETSAEKLSVGVLLADQLQTMAESVGAAIGQAPTRFGGCNMPTDACRDAFIRALGSAAFRRPVDDTQLAEYRSIYELARSDGHGPAAALVAEAMLSSPFFLYRPELGSPAGEGQWALSDDELASQLSYFLTGGPPDAQLRAAADAKMLHEPAQLEAHATRLLQGHDGLGGFVDAWLELDRLDTLPKEPPVFTPAIRAAMREEARRYFAQVLESGGSWQTLLTARYGIVDRQLAAFYGQPAPTGVTFEKVDWPEGRRTGLLTLGALLATHGKPSGSSPVHRGAVIRARMLCQPPPPPPPNVNATPPPEQAGRTTRDRFVAHSANPSCAGCHSMLDPLGFALEHFDGIGQERALDNGLAIDATGKLLATTPADATFDGARSLSEAIANSEEGRSCFVTQVLRFGMGMSGARDPFTCVGSSVANSMTPTTPLRDVVLALVKADGFRLRAGATNGVQPMLPPPVLTMPMPPTPQPMNGLQVTRTTQSSWPTGYCDDVTVKNVGTVATDWAVELAVEGTINNAWNTQFTASGSNVRFAGVAWNSRLEPMASAAFGFCAMK
ncbi:MAG: DUF1588 domain-containing protein [Archangiaceae bacterium]|nr:DUF1588 domain-containing protein [Archangiaceae bacterium]